MKPSVLGNVRALFVYGETSPVSEESHRAEERLGHPVIRQSLTNSSTAVNAFRVYELRSHLQEEIATGVSTEIC